MLFRSEDFTAIVWDRDSGRPLTPPLLHENQVSCAAFSPDARWVVTGGADKTMRIWHVETGDPLIPPVNLSSAPRQVHFSPSGDEILLGGKGSDSWVYRVNAQSLPLAKLRQLGEFFSGMAAGEDRGATNRSLARTWEDLRRWYPEQLVPHRTSNFVAAGVR